jgi:hypothetical protein
MLDLKPYFDAVNTANEEVQRIAAEIDAAFQLGTDEGKTQALALRPALDEAQSKADEAMKLYDSLKKANQPSNLAAAFVPVSQTPTTPDDEQPKGVMKRKDFLALNSADREAHIRGGGTIED